MVKYVKNSNIGDKIMKKIFKTLAVCAVAGTLCAGVAAVAGCNNGTTGEAYGLVHGAGYVGYATVTVSGDKVTDATLTEVCFPTQVTADANVADADKVTVGEGDKAKSYYKTVSYGEVTMTYDAADGYKVGNTVIKEYLKDAAKAEAYYKAVMKGEVTVTIGTEKKTGVMTKAALSKDENGYWSTNLGTKLGWKANRDATVKYVKDHGVDNLLKLTQNKDTGMWMDGDISTGATWNDLNSVKEGSLSYAQLIVNAYNAAKAK